jgi:DNA-directed RNA polymerase specialized sigma24 family protein
MSTTTDTAIGINFNDPAAVADEYKRVTAIVMRVLRASVGMDREALVSDIVFDEYKTGTRYGWQKIRFRCIDTLRRLRSEHKRNHGRTVNPSVFHTDHEALAAEVGDFVRDARLETNERQIVYYVFYKGLNPIQAGAVLGIEDRDAARSLLETAIEKLKRVARARQD